MGRSINSLLIKKLDHRSIIERTRGGLDTGILGDLFPQGPTGYRPSMYPSQTLLAVRPGHPFSSHHFTTTAHHTCNKRRDGMNKLQNNTAGSIFVRRNVEYNAEETISTAFARCT